MMAEEKEERPTVMVGCKVPNGVEIHVMKRRNEDYTVDGVTGLASGIKDLGFIKLKGTAVGKPHPEGFTAVDREMWDTWFAENEDHPLLVGGSIFVPKEEEPVSEADHDHGDGEEYEEPPHTHEEQSLEVEEEPKLDVTHEMEPESVHVAPKPKFDPETGKPIE